MMAEQAVITVPCLAAPRRASISRALAVANCTIRRVGIDLAVLRIGIRSNQERSMAENGEYTTSQHRS
jgi:hypothetical protein